MNLEKAKIALKKYFGYDNFRPMQADIVQSVYDLNDTLVLMPTGGGKSICYQIPAVTMDGIAVVVSPLISLMKDQVEGLQATGIKASFLNSSLSSVEQRAVEDDIFNQNIDLIYVSPEKIVSPNFLSLLQRVKIALFAIDEAHCISSWGHDFRPEYTQLKFIKRHFPTTPIIALTATADKATRKDISAQLDMYQPKIFVASFDRPNLSLEVKPGQKKFEQIMQFVKKRPNQPGIIYCLSRKNTENLADKLQMSGLNAKAYHAGLPPSQRSKVQEDFINDVTEIVCATVAFGMGIDKSNVRWVIHYNLPKNIESFYQEIGRAGRDGTNASTLLFYSFADIRTLREILSKNESAQVDLKLAKLERMQQYAESLSCRRKILLNYFSEPFEKACGNCDICKNPPQYFDGTVIAQKALSAAYRLKQSVGTLMLIDVLRGSNRREIFERGYNKIKTYGAGGDFSTRDWQFFLMQLINLGYLEVAYDANNVLRLTTLSHEVLFNKKKVELVKAQVAETRAKKAKAQAKAKPKRERVRDELFEILRVKRRELAQQRGVPPYVIFSDATLEEMAAKRPTIDADLMEISGVGERKLQLYGNFFMDKIIDYIKSKIAAGEKLQGSTYILTYELYKQGLTIQEIAEKRALNPVTIYSHIAYLYEKGEPIDLFKYFTAEEYERIEVAIKAMKPPFQMKDIFEYLQEEVPYYKIRLGFSHYSKLTAE
ncbi:MAG: DNA helicase RecQ [Saprospiraceae bacterium]